MSRTPEAIRVRRQKEKIKKNKSSSTERWYRKVWAGFLTFLGIVLSAYGFIPKVNVEAQGTARPHDPMGTVFLMTNNSVLPIHNIQVKCGVLSATAQNGDAMKG